MCSTFLSIFNLILKYSQFWPFWPQKRGFLTPNRVILVKSVKQPQKWIPWYQKHICRGVTLVFGQNIAVLKIFWKMSKFKMAAILNCSGDLLHQFWACKQVKSETLDCYLSQKNCLQFYRGGGIRTIAARWTISGGS